VQAIEAVNDIDVELLQEFDHFVGFECFPEQRKYRHVAERLSWAAPKASAWRLGQGQSIRADVVAHARPQVVDQPFPAAAGIFRRRERHRPFGVVVDQLQEFDLRDAGRRRIAAMVGRRRRLE
jgi:hypothetical protein